MICDHYKHALLELAAAGTEPHPALRAHLQACSACRSVFENERSLFDSIDSSLRSSTNADIPASFIPTIRAQLWRRSPPAQGSGRVTDRRLWLSALAAAAIILFIFMRLDHQVKSPSTDEPSVTQRPQSPVEQQAAAAKPLQNPVPRITSAIAKNSAAKDVITHEQKSLQINSREPEIIVPPDQEILLARYADQWSRHSHSSTLVTEIDSDQSDLPQVQLIQIAELDVKPLADHQAYDQAHAQE